MKLWTVLTLVLIVTVLASGVRCEEEETIKIGALFAVTGSAAWLGEPEKNTAEMLANEVNAAGGINGKKVELIVEDTEGDNTKAVQAASKLINKEKVVAIIGPSRSGTTMAVVPVVQKAQVPLISCAAAAPIVTPVEERKWVFKTPQMDSDAVIRIYEHMKSKGIKKIAIITGTTGFGSSGRDQLKKYAEEMGIEIVADETYAPSDTSMIAQLTKIKNSDAQAIVNWSIVPAQSIVPKNMKQLDMKIQLYQSHGFGNVKYAEAAGDAAEGILFPAGPLLAVESLPEDHPQKKVLMQYKNDYEKHFGDTASTFGGHSFDAFNMVKLAIEKEGPTRDGIRKGLEEINGYVGTAGIFKLSPSDHVGLDKYAFEMLTVKDGKFVVLTE